jgi:DNA replication protein DnaC
VKRWKIFASKRCRLSRRQQIPKLAGGGYLSRSEPIIFLVDTGTGKTHLATGLAVEACRQRKRVRFTTAVVQALQNKGKTVHRNPRRGIQHLESGELPQPHGDFKFKFKQ